ncbi:hypothetical protein, variant [Allomyces macrogynus ATCC 38327]|uniref:HPt domain-containing protein n=1 Tax=Allomyces macrogynus (strain ATCC 38327) TaxID=578462 RepID=A0A0L0T688_ALLM3|nr:hypothetical protein, variant [Allomyces macrogynus ATCC 38327]|eukprot:KNE70272.1 hypothetical protein, variant [Allomyces macrogynus ATCC 38327]
MPGEPLPADVVDMATFEELLEMDEDDPGFSQSLVENFFEQTEDVLKEMQRSLALRNLDALSRQGHFLKGSAAAIGIIELRKAFERIQYLGQGKGASDPHVSCESAATCATKPTAKVIGDWIRS